MESTYPLVLSHRYSMYFGRWKAYEMMLNQEKRQGYQYDWVIHARLDCAWGAPIPSYQYFSKGKIYAPDSWFVEIPDTFSIMTRNISDIYYSMETLLKPKVFCLGGPNLNVNKLLPNNLQAMGYSQQDIEIVHQEDCRNKFPEYHIVNVPRQKLNWSTAGYSEYILKR